MKRLSAILLVAVTFFALFGSPGIRLASDCSSVETSSHMSWCVK